VQADILLAIDTGDLACLALLDLSAAFDTVDHDVLLQRLSTTCGIDGMAWMWFRSYLSDRSQYVRVRTGLSSTALMRYGVPQGSVLGPILFLLYTADYAKLVESHGVFMSIYADGLWTFWIFSICILVYSLLIAYCSIQPLAAILNKPINYYMASVRRHRLISCSCACRPASMMLLIGCHQTGYSLMPPRRRSCGAHQHGDRVTCLVHLFEYAVTM